jgi:hypothetical protein
VPRAFDKRLALRTLASAEFDLEYPVTDERAADIADKCDVWPRVSVRFVFVDADTEALRVARVFEKFTDIEKTIDRRLRRVPAAALALPRMDRSKRLDLMWINSPD